jgi:transcription elongation factor Elf1
MLDVLSASIRYLPPLSASRNNCLDCRSDIRPNVAMVETLLDVLHAGARLYVRCLAKGGKCDQHFEMDVKTLIWTRGRRFLVSALSQRLRCPHCGSRKVRVVVSLPKNGAKASADRPYEPVNKFAPDLYASGSCVYRLDASDNVIEIAAWAQSSGVAGASLGALKKQYPEHRFQQRRRGWVESD